MNNGFYRKLAFTNIKKNAKNYIPYILSCICTVMMFYIMGGFVNNTDINEYSATLAFTMELGLIVIGIFSVIFLFYTNSFLLKERKKEFGLFNILGLEKKHISKIMLWETIYVAVTTIVMGILAGTILGKLMYMLLYKLVKFSVPFGLNLSLKAIISTVVLFVIIFTINLLYGLKQIHLSQPIELLRGGEVGEKEPKTKLLMAVLGFLCLGGGYYISVTTENPLEAFLLFFVAVVLVIVGTYLLFTAGSIVLLKTLRKNKNYYYKSKNFTAVSSMMYRMKQNAAGLANICILSTMVLVMLSSTVCLYIGADDMIKSVYPRDICMRGYLEEDNISISDIEKIVKDEAEKLGVNMSDLISYRSEYYLAYKENEKIFRRNPNDIGEDHLKKTIELIIVPLDEYNSTEGIVETLNDNEVIIYSKDGSVLEEKITISEEVFYVKSNPTDMKLAINQLAPLYDTYYIVFSNEDIVKKVGTIIGNAEINDVRLQTGYYFNIDDKEKMTILNNNIEKRIDSVFKTNTISVNDRLSNTQGFYEFSGGFLFLGIFLGLLFIMATILSIYYKQVSEGYDDKKRFEIMQKVGMSLVEVKKSIGSQVLTVFFLPIIMATIHCVFAFPLIARLFLLFGLFNQVLFVICMAFTIIVFLIFYAIIYALTSKTYYKIVKQD